jgi:hypothetical protein
MGTFDLILNESVRVKIELCNYMGQVVQSAVDDAFVPGYHSKTLSTKGSPPGVYFIRITVNNFSFSEKIIKVE